MTAEEIYFDSILNLPSLYGEDAEIPEQLQQMLELHVQLKLGSAHDELVRGAYQNALEAHSMSQTTPYPDSGLVPDTEAFNAFWRRVHEEVTRLLEKKPL